MSLCDVRFRLDTGCEEAILGFIFFRFSGEEKPTLFLVSDHSAGQ